MNIVAIIPARSGSKSVPHKNIRKLNDKPMLAYSIEHGLKSKYINRVIVSTDSSEYAEIARRYGAEIPFLRPEEYARDDSLDYDVFYHVLNFLREKENYEADIMIQLRPTYPIRQVSDIDAMIELILSDEAIDSVRSLSLAKEIPYKMWFQSDSGKIEPIMREIPECYNMPRQQLPKVYYQNACIDVLRPRVLFEQHSMTGSNIMGYVMSENFDIDTEEEFLLAEAYIKIINGGKRFVFDIDGVIAQLQEQNNYELSKPNNQMIQVVNKLHELGNEIILHTARGYVTGKNWETITKNQLTDWNVSYDELHFGKPNADYYVDDKMIPMELILKLVK